MEKVTLIKLGGSLITDKNEYKTPRRENIRKLVSEIKEALEERKDLKLVIGHGVGSYGHILASKFQTHEGYDKDQKDAQIAFSQIHNNDVELNSIIADEFLKAGIPIINIFPLNLIITKDKKAVYKHFQVITEALKKGFIPLLFGDVIMDTKLGSTIYSADRTLPLVGEYLMQSKKYEISEILFVGDYDGVKDKDGNIISHINKENYIEVKKNFFQTSTKDVTGGMAGKVKELLDLADLGLSSKIINGGTPGRLKNALRGETVTATKIESMKATVEAPANIALVKFWGRKNEALVLPYNDSISMAMSNCITKTTVHFSEEYKEDSIEIIWEDGTVEKQIPLDGTKTQRSFEQIERVRRMAGINYKARIVSTNNFPTAAGIASSASSLCALTMALVKAAGIEGLIEDKKELSKLIRMSGSGSATRSVYDGFAQWVAGKDHDTSYAEQIAPASHWDLAFIVAIVNPEIKYISSSEGHKLAITSPYFEKRLEEVPERIRKVRQAILNKDFPTLGTEMEADALSMHMVMMTSKPSVNYWTPGSISVFKEVQRWRREEGLEAYWTMDAGPNVKVLCRKEDALEVEERLLKNEFVQSTIYNENNAEAHIIQNHLF